ncbi:protein argonaute-3 [Pisolithus marmoratus]|nr:protein argonaute-3 [Pisolithus marmoratus]
MPREVLTKCRINVKLGGINTIPDPQSGLMSSTQPLGSEGCPLFTALVGNVDSDTAKYIATCRVQTSQKEIIEDLGEMAQKKTSNIAPMRLIFFGGGVSEGQFQEVLDFGGSALAHGTFQLLTLVNRTESSASGNCPAGTVVNQVVAHPVEFDWYLLSHGGLLGTSRPAHYNVFYDDNNFRANGLQSLAFALCHVYARSTRSVSILAPVYCESIVIYCLHRAKNHYDPQESMSI